MRINIEIDYDKLCEKIGPGRVIYFIKLGQSMNKKNEIDLSILELPKGTFNTIRHLFIKEGIIKKCKLGDDTVKKYYFNPIYGTITSKITVELYEAFNEINGDKIY